MNTTERPLYPIYGDRLYLSVTDVCELVPVLKENSFTEVEMEKAKFVFTYEIV
jgi:hypothetical protein